MFNRSVLWYLRCKMSVEQKVKQTVYNTSKAIVKEVGEKLGLEFDQNSLDIIAELTYKRLNVYGSDLDAFQKHAKRSTINADDVKLLVRRNDSLKDFIETKLQAIMFLKPPSDISVKRKRK